MEVGRQVQGRPEALDERDRAALPLADAVERPRSPSLVREDRAQEGAKYFTRQPRVPGAAVAKRVRKREHPLPDRDLGQHPVDEMSRGVGHPPATTRGTESAPLARKADEAIVSAGVAVDAQESMSQYAAFEIGADLSLDEAGNGGALRFRSE